MKKIVFALALSTLLTAIAYSVRAATTIYYCRGASPWQTLDFIVWVQRECAWLPMVIH